MMKFACTCPSPISGLSHASISRVLRQHGHVLRSPSYKASFQKSSRVFPLFASMFRAYALNVGLAMFPHRQRYLLSRTPLKIAYSDLFLMGVAQSCKRVLFRCAFHLTHLRRSRTESDLWPLSQ